MIPRIRPHRLPQPANALLVLTAVVPSVAACMPQTTHVGIFHSSRNASNSAASNPILAEYLRKKPTGKSSTPLFTRGGLTSSSLFDEGDAPEPVHPTELAQPDAPAQIKSGSLRGRDPSSMAAALDPDPRSRERWERKMVIRSVRRSGRLTKAQAIKQTERESSSRSPFFPTSVKKLGMLARQIQGKTVEDAIVQMQLSKKKVAAEVAKTLQLARDEAIVKRGMGLGKANGTEGAPVEVVDKKGKKRTVTDRTTMYVDQAWVGRGQFGMEPDYRARGRVYMMRKPNTSISVVLKEEATRVRLSEELKQKRANRKLWVQLPNRPITAQRQYYLW